MNKDYHDETDSPYFHALVAAGFEREVEDYGIADRMRRMPVDPLYAHEPAYLVGRREGLRLPPYTELP